MEKISIIQKVKYVKGWPGKTETLFYHELTMQNGDEGKLEGNNEESPTWLVLGNTIKYSIWMSPRGMLIKPLGQINNNGHTDSYSPAPQRKNNQEQPPAPKQNYGSRLDSDPAFRLRQQKCISLTTCLDRANELVIAGKIEIKGKHGEALSDFKFIMKHSGISEMEQELCPGKQEDNPELPNPKTEAPVQSALFDAEADKPISPFIKESISRCTTPKQLSNLKTQLLPEEINNKNVNAAIKTKLEELKSK